MVSAAVANVIGVDNDALLYDMVTLAVPVVCFVFGLTVAYCLESDDVVIANAALAGRASACRSGAE